MPLPSLLYVFRASSLRLLSVPPQCLSPLSSLPLLAVALLVSASSTGLLREPLFGGSPQCPFPASLMSGCPVVPLLSVSPMCLSSMPSLPLPGVSPLSNASSKCLRRDSLHCVYSVSLLGASPEWLSCCASPQYLPCVPVLSGLSVRSASSQCLSSLALLNVSTASPGCHWRDAQRKGTKDKHRRNQSQ